MLRALATLQADDALESYYLTALQYGHRQTLRVAGFSCFAALFL